MTRSTRLAVLVLLLAAFAWATTLTAGAASAHAARVSTDPADHATVSTGPAQVSATFNEDLQTRFAAITVVGPDGNMWTTGEPHVNGTVASIGVRPLGPTGNYTVNYRVTSADGHVVAGSWSFQLTTPGTGTPGPSAQAPDGRPDDVPVWPFAVGAIALVGAGIWWSSRNKS